MAKCQHTQCDLIFACDKFCTGGNSSPVGRGVKTTCNVKERGVDMVQCFHNARTEVDNKQQPRHPMHIDCGWFVCHADALTRKDKTHYTDWHFPRARNFIGSRTQYYHDQMHYGLFVMHFTCYSDQGEQFLKYIVIGGGAWNISSCSILNQKHIHDREGPWQLSLGTMKAWFAVPRLHFAWKCHAPFCQQDLWLATARLLGGYGLYFLHQALTPSHFHLSVSLNYYLTGKWFASDSDVKQAFISWFHTHTHTHTHTLDTSLFYVWMQYKNVSGDYMKVWCIACATNKLTSQYSSWHQRVCYHIFWNCFAIWSVCL